MFPVKAFFAGWISWCLLGGLAWGYDESDDSPWTGLDKAAPCEYQVPTSRLSLEVRRKLLGSVEKPGRFHRELLERGFRPGSPVLFRSYKGTEDYPRGVLEAWILKSRNGGASQFELFKRYPIFAWGGGLGPKLREGDKQSPEGFYAIRPDQMNPNSQYHLSMDVGYPNAFDRSLGRTGGDIMIHGSDESIGCFAMGDPAVEEIYTLAEAALIQCVREVPFISLPFVMNARNLDSARDSKWFSFWENLAEGDRIFEERRLLPAVGVEEGRYQFRFPGYAELFSH